MADLEELGFLSQPHTSAGRIPTDKGYRFFVDALLIDEKAPGNHELSGDFIPQFSKKLDGIKSDLNAMFSEVTDTLSMLSHYVGVVIPPKSEKITFKKLDLLRYKGSHVVAILLTNEGIIKNRILTVDPKLTQDDLNRIADYLKSEFSGCIIDEIKGMIMKMVKRDKMMWDDLVVRAMNICEQALSYAGDGIFMSGIYDVMDLPDFSDIDRIRELSKAIKDKHLILDLLDEFSEAQGVRVVIGDENPVENLRKLSIVTASYGEGVSPMGLVALIGPTRMDYSKAIFMVNTVARCVSNTFGS
jgi:heat-inducible transcriptional repressor